MSYLQRKADLSGFNQATISFWFKVPQSSMDAAGAAATGADGALFDGIVPFVVMGKEGKESAPYTQSSEQVLANTTNVTYVSHRDPDVSTNECLNYTTVIIITTPVTYCSDKLFSHTWGPVTFSTSTETQNLPIQSVSTSGPAQPKNPTFIGVDRYGTLNVNFETAKQGAASNLSFVITSIDPGSFTCPGGSQWGGLAWEAPPDAWAYPAGTDTTTVHYSGPLDYVGTVTDQTFGHHWVENPAYSGNPNLSCSVRNYMKNNWTDITNIVQNGTGTINFSGAVITADQWHHILVSVDLSQTIATHGTSSRLDDISNVWNYVDGAATLYVAVDDVDQITGTDDGTHNHAVLTEEAWQVAAAIRTYDVVDSDAGSTEVAVGGVASYSLDASIPDGALGLPATATYVDHVHHCEMAEFQMWIGKTLDTSVVSNRRAFIDYPRDANGQPIPDKNGNLVFKPVNPAKAEKLMGRKPDIMLHGSGNWIKGKDSGSLGINLNPTGKIKRYSPDPSIPAPAP